MSLVLNFSPIRFDDSEINVGQLPYGDDGKEVLKQLRKDHNATHVFRREGADRILAVSVVSDASVLGELKTVRLKNHLGLVAALVRNALLRYLSGMGRPVLSYDPLEFIARQDLLRMNPPQGISPPGWLAVRLLYEVAVRPIHFPKQEPFVAAVLDVRTTRLIERSAWELMQDGFSLEGFYVGRRVPSSDPQMAPHFELLGCVKSAEGSQLRLTDCREDIETVEASDVWLEKRAFVSCLSHVFGGRAPEVVEALERERAALRQGPTRLDHITKTVDFLGRTRHEMAPGLPFTFGPLLDSAKASFPRLESAPRAVYVFDPTGSKTDIWHDRGLTEHGPYTAQVFTPNQPRICVVCQQSKKGQVEQFLHKFVRRRDYYLCSGRKRKAGCLTPYMRREKLEPIIDSLLSNQLTNRSFLDRLGELLAQSVDYLALFFALPHELAQ